MGNQVDSSTGKLVFNGTPQTIADFQALADRVDSDATPSVAAVSDLDNVPRKRPGMVRLVTASGTAWQYISAGVGWRLLSLNVQGAGSDPATEATLGNPTTWTVMPDPFGTALQRDFTKFSGSSRLRVQIDASMKLDSGGEQVLFLGLRLNSTNYEVTRRLFLTAPYRQGLSGNLILSGVAAGTYTIRAIVQSQAASLIKFTPGYDPFHWTIEEIG